MGGDPEKEPKEEKKESTDTVQNAIGDFGRWQLYITIWLSLLKVPVAWHNLGIVFLAPPVESWCSKPVGLVNLTTEEWRNISRPPDVRSCSIYDRNYTDDADNSTRIVECTQWDYDRSTFQETIITQWNLVCDRGQLANVAQTIFMFGVLLGNVLFGMAADRYGRKLPLMIAIVLQIVAGVGSAFVPWFEMFLVLRFLDALATGGTMLTSFVICMEIIGGWYRTAVAFLYHIPFNLGHSLLAAVAYYARDWRSFQFYTSIPSVILLFYWWTVPESPRWLLAVGKNKEAIVILEEAAAKNGLDVQSISSQVQAFSDLKGEKNEINPEKKANIMDLFRTPNLRTKTLCVYFNWVVCGLCFYGLAQYMGQVGGNIFVNVAISGAIELPGSVACIYFNNRFGRRLTMLTSQMVTAISCLLIMAVPHGEGDVEWPKVTLAALGIVGTSVSFPTIYLFSGELFPTVVRNVGVGSASMCARIGSMAAPFITSLSSVSFYLPPLFFGIVPFIGSLLCLLLPETRNCELPDTLEEGENFGKKVKETSNGRANTAFVSEDSQL